MLSNACGFSLGPTRVSRLISRSVGPNDEATDFALLLSSTESLQIVYSGTSGPRFVTADNVLVTGEWQHILLTYSVSGDALRLYVNGKNVREAPSNGALRRTDSVRTCLGNSDLDFVQNVPFYLNGLLRERERKKIKLFAFRWIFSFSNVSRRHESKRSTTTLF